MSQYFFDFESVPVGTAASSVNTGFDSVSTTGTGTSVGDSTHVASGSVAVKVSPSSGGQNTFSKTGIVSAIMAVRFAVYMTSLAAADTWLASFFNGSTRLATVHLNSAGHLRLDNAAGTTGVYTDPNTFPLNQWVWVNLWSQAGSTGVDGGLRATLDLGDSTSPITDSGMLTNQNTGTAGSFTTLTIGKANASTYATPFWIDKATIDDLTFDIIPSTPPAGATVVAPRGGAVAGGQAPVVEGTTVVVGGAPGGATAHGFAPIVSAPIISGATVTAVRGTATAAGFGPVVTEGSAVNATVGTASAGGFAPTVTGSNPGSGFTPRVWFDGPDGLTPIDASNLNRIEEAIAQLYIHLGL